MILPAFIRPALFFSVIAVLIITVVVIFRKGSNSAPAQLATQQLPPNIDIALKQVRFSEMKEGVLDWELIAEKVEYDKSGEVAYLNGGIKMNFVKSATRGAIKVTADNGEFRTNSKNIKLRGKVHLLTDDGASFRTDSIDYTSAVSQFKTADKVAFRQERLVLNAIGMEMDVKTQQARFFSQIDATVAGVAIRGLTPGATVKTAR